MYAVFIPYTGQCMYTWSCMTAIYDQSDVCHDIIMYVYIPCSERLQKRKDMCVNTVTRDRYDSEMIAFLQINLLLKTTDRISSASMPQYCVHENIGYYVLYIYSYILTPKVKHHGYVCMFACVCTW